MKRLVLAIVILMSVVPAAPEAQRVAWSTSDVITMEGRIDGWVLTNKVTVILTAAEKAALDWWVTEGRPRLPFSAEKVTPEEYVTSVVSGHLADIVIRHQEAQAFTDAATSRPVMDRLKRLDKKRCADLAKELGVDITTLPCGGLK